MIAEFVYNNYYIILIVPGIVLAIRHKKINRVYAMAFEGSQSRKSQEQLKNI